MNVVLYFQSKLKTSAEAKLGGIRSIAEKAGWHVQLVERQPTRTALRELVGYWRPVGAIVECANRKGSLDPSVFGTLPVVYLDWQPSALPHGAFGVSHDSRQTGAEAARTLLKTGYRNFAYISSPQPSHWSDDRRTGFAEALKVNGYAPRTLPSGPAGETSMAFQRRLHGFLSALPRPAALFAANDETAERVLAEALRIGLRVPADLAVLGVDNYEPLCEYTVPALSSVEPDFRRGGTLAMLMLAGLVRDGCRFKGKRQLTFGPLQTVQRASTRVLASAQTAEMSSALELIRREACNGLSAEDVLRTFSCSRTLAAAKFRRATGHTVLAEIHAVQLDRAKALLADPHQQIKAISDFCGLAHPNSLKKLFRRETGMSMTDWRKQGARGEGHDQELAILSPAVRSKRQRKIS